MMKFLLFVSLAVCLLVGCSPKVAPITVHQSDRFWLPQLRDSLQKNSYYITLDRNKVNISGIWILKQVDGQQRGTLINEFGIKAFDFTCNAEKCQLYNVISFANKWYIKKAIANDLQFMLEIDNPAYTTGQTANRNWKNDTLIITCKNKKTLQRLPTNEMTMYNKKHHLTYTFKKIEE